MLKNCVNIPANHAFMTLPELTAAARRNITTMSNIYTCHNSSGFTFIHDAICSKTERSDQTIRYLKGLMTYFQIARAEEIED